MADVVAYDDDMTETDAGSETVKATATHASTFAAGDHWIFACGSMSADDLPTRSRVKIVDEFGGEFAPQCIGEHQATDQYKPIATAEIGEPDGLDALYLTYLSF